MKNPPTIVVEEESSRNAIVLTIASASKNSITQLFPDRVQISTKNIEDLNRKLVDKLRLHRITDVKAGFSIKFDNDRTLSIDSIESFCSLDDKIDLLTSVITARWSFIFDAEATGAEHVHSISLRISESPNPGLLFQRFFSGKQEDLESLDGEAFAPISCKIDFLDGRFSSELLAVIAEWVKSLPKAEPVFAAARWLNKHSDFVTEFIFGTFPPLAMLASVAIWMAYLPSWMNNSIKIGVAWIALTGVVLLLARYFAVFINRALERHLHRICNVPVFQVTSGDKNRLTRYLSKSQRSFYALGIAGLIYGVFKGIGVYLAGVLIARLFQ